MDDKSGIAVQLILYWHVSCVNSLVWIPKAFRGATRWISRYRVHYTGPVAFAKGFEQSKMREESDKGIRDGISPSRQRGAVLESSSNQHGIAVSRISETKWPGAGMNMNEPSGWYSEARNKIISFSAAPRLFRAPPPRARQNEPAEKGGRAPWRMKDSAL